MELTDEEQKELGRLIAEGNTSGRLDSENEKGRGVYIAWELTTNKWEDDDEDECPHCAIALEDKMIDIDGTNLEEHKVCPECGYGTPALR